MYFLSSIACRVSGHTPNANVCRYQLHPYLANTFIHRTHLPLHKWFFALFLFSTSRQLGVAALGDWSAFNWACPIKLRLAHGALGPTNTWPAWTARLRWADRTAAMSKLDETYVGGRTTVREGRGRGAPNKTVVFGMLERCAATSMATVVPNVRMNQRFSQSSKKDVVARQHAFTLTPLKSYNGSCPSRSVG